MNFFGKNSISLKEKLNIKENKALSIYLISFFAPIGILLIIYILRKVYPFGESAFLRSDMYHQYAPFHAALMDKLKNGETLYYSWDIGMGMNFFALFAYYLATPFNIVLLVIPQSILIEYMSVLIFIKVGLCGLTFSYYLCKRFQTYHKAVAVISLFYALSAYICSYSWNLMWLDCIWLFPLIIWGLERLVQEKKCFLYCLTLGLCIISNFYIAIMVCIFCVLYFILLMLTRPDAMKEWWIKTIYFGFFSILAGGFAAFLLFPEFYALQLTASGDMNFPKTLTRYFSILEMMSRQLIVVEPAIFSAHEPNIYSGMLVFLLVPLYALNPKASTKEKIGRFILVFLFYISFNLNIPNYIWHGFHFPNSLPCRQSFIFNFLLLVMSFEGLLWLKESSKKELTAIVGGSLLLCLMIEQLFADNEYPYYIAYVSGVFIAVYGILAAAYRSGKLKSSIIMILFFAVAWIEAFINTNATSVSITGRNSYVSDNEDIETLLDSIPDEDFYRVEKLKRRTKNDAAWHHYHGVSLFSSTANAGVGEFLSGMGGENSTNSYAYYGATPLVDALLSVRYVLSKENVDDTALRVKQMTESEEYLYKNMYILPLGFWLPSELEENWDTKLSNPFTVQNIFAQLACNVSPLFTNLNGEISNNNITIDVPIEQRVYVYVTSAGESFKAVIQRPGEDSERNMSFTGVNQKYMMDLGVHPAGTVITFSANDEDTIQGYVYGLDDSNFIALIQTLQQGGMTVTSYDETHVLGTVDVERDGVFFCSIPYEKGWTVLVDGEVVETRAYEEAFLSFDITAGEHELEFSYAPYGLSMGIGISAASVVIFLLTLFGSGYKKRFGSVLSKAGNEEIEDEDVGHK